MRILFTIVISLQIFGFQASHVDSTKTSQVIDLFKKGHFSGQLRNFTMSTINQGELSDYYTNAIGASIHYETAEWKGFRLGLNGLFVYKTFSNDLLSFDSLAGGHSAYELQLFDVEYPGNYTDLDRLEELFLEYRHKHWLATFGKMEIETPLVNLHDGRMKPKVFMGGKSEYQTDKLLIFGAWLWKASPRSITHWYSIGDAIGLYNNGCLHDGSVAHYHEHIESKGLGIAGLEYQLTNSLSLKTWDYLLENVSNTFMSEVNYKDSSFFIGLMYLNQFGINHGGNPHASHTYFNPDLKTHVVSARLAYSLNSHSCHISGTHVLEHGNFIFPREFGVDPFYTFIPRSQIEGAGDATALTLGYQYQLKKWRIDLAWNRMILSQDFRYNKYNMPAYDQFNLDIHYCFSDSLEGLEMRFLYVLRNAIWEDISYVQTFNKVNFNQLNLIFNFNF